MQLRNSIIKYLNELKFKNYSAKTISRRRYSLLKFSSTTNDLDLESITEFAHSISNLKSAYHLISDIRCFIQFLEKYELIDDSLSDKIVLPKQSRLLPKIIYSQTEILELIDSIPVKEFNHLMHKTLLYVLYSTGSRNAELVNLKIQDINKEFKHIIVRGKNKKERYIPITDKLIEIINFYLDYRLLKSPYLFINKFGRQLNKEIVNDIIKIYFPTFTAHSFRHHIAVHLIENGADVRYVQVFLGHANITTTRIYTHVSRGQLKLNYHMYHQLQEL